MADQPSQRMCPLAAPDAEGLRVFAISVRVNGTAAGPPRHPGDPRSRWRRWRRAVAAPGRRDPVPEDTHHQPDGAGAATGSVRPCPAGQTRAAGSQQTVSGAVPHWAE